MNAKEIRQRQIEKVDELLKQADKLTPEARAEYLIDQGVEVPEHAYWIRDETYTGNNKEIYYCTHCDHWQSVKKQKEQIMYMRRCPFCGSKMSARQTSKLI